MTPERALALLARFFQAVTWPFVRYEVRGGRCAKELTVGVIAANHRSLFDVIAGLVCLHRFGHYPRLLVERKYVEKGIVGRCARAIGCIPVDRGGTRGEALAEAHRMMAEERVPVLVMPEGRLHWDPAAPLTTGPAHSGVSRLATHGPYPVVAAALAGTERVLPSHAKLPRFNPFRRKVVACVVADDPLWLRGEDHAANAETVMAAIRDLMAVAQEIADGR